MSRGTGVNEAYGRGLPGGLPVTSPVPGVRVIGQSKTTATGGPDRQHISGVDVELDLAAEILLVRFPKGLKQVLSELAGFATVETEGGCWAASFVPAFATGAATATI